MDGRFETARELLADANAIFEDLGQTRYSSVPDIDGIVEFLAGDLAAAERRLRAGYLALEEMGDRAFRPTTAAHLADAVYAQGRDDDAKRLTEISRAKVIARQGRIDEAEDLAREAVTISASTDFLNTRADALVDLARIHHQAGRLDEKNAAVAEGIALYEQKGNRVAAGKARTDLAILDQV